MNKSPQYNQQTDRQVISTESLKLRKYVGIYQNLESGCRRTASISENEYSDSHARKNLKQQYLKVVRLSDASFSKKHIYVYDHTAWIIH